MVKKSVIREIFDKAPKNAINLGLGELQFPMPDNLNSVALQVLLEEKIGYTPNAGLINSRKAIADQYEDVVPEQVIIMNGAEECLYATLKTLVKAGDEVLIPDPGFSAYKTIIEMVGGIPVSYELNEFRDFSLDIKRIQSKISDRTKIIILNNPSNPTSSAIDNVVLEEIANLMDSKNIYMISDEIYRDLYLSKRPETILTYSKNAIVISGLSKSHCMTGWRIGWVISPIETTSSITVTHQYISTCANYLGQRLVEYAFDDKSRLFQRELRVRLRFNFKLVKEYLSNLLPYEPASAPYVFINVGEDGYGFAEKLLDKGVIVIPGIAFSERLSKFVRISYGLDYDELKKGLEILKKELI